MIGSGTFSTCMAPLRTTIGQQNDNEGHSDEQTGVA